VNREVRAHREVWELFEDDENRKASSDRCADGMRSSAEGHPSNWDGSFEEQSFAHRDSKMSP
jgi:hypothetical protein